MTNRTIALIFVVLSWTLLAMCLVAGYLLFDIYAVICVGLSHTVYHRQDNL